MTEQEPGDDGMFASDGDMYWTATFGILEQSIKYRDNKCQTTNSRNEI